MFVLAKAVVKLSTQRRFNGDFFEYTTEVTKIFLSFRALGCFLAVLFHSRCLSPVGINDKQIHNLIYSLVANGILVYRTPLG